MLEQQRKNSREGRARLVATAMMAVMGAAAWAAPVGPEEVLVVDLCDNGDFASPGRKLGRETFERVPGWRFRDGGADQIRIVDGALVLGPGSGMAVQPVAGYAPLIGGVVIAGRVRGAGVLRVSGGDGEVFELRLESSDSEASAWRPFTWSPPAKGPALVPRFEVALGAGTGQSAAFDDLHINVPLPAANAAKTHNQVEALAIETLDELMRFGRDRVGPRPTQVWIGRHNVDSSKPFGQSFQAVGMTPLHGFLLTAVAIGLGEKSGTSGVPFSTRLEELAVEFMDLCVNEQTHLPQRFNPHTDKPLPAGMIESAMSLGYLIDLAGGRAIGSHMKVNRRVLPVDLETRAFEAACAMGQALLDHAVLPDGNLSALVRPSDGQTSGSTTHLRRLDNPSQLVRLAALCKQRGVKPALQAKLIFAAREAVLEVEYANYWPGNWDTVDPGFDDSYGHIGARSATMTIAWPEEPAFARLALSGRDKYMGIWAAALAFGGNIAADQVRCWRVLSELALQYPDHEESKALGTVLRAAMRVHFKGQATRNGGWLDVTVVGFDPATNLPVGDVIGLPQNQLAGLGMLHGSPFGRSPQHADEVRALFSTLLATTARDYKSSFGFADGSRSSAGSVRVMQGLLSWLEGDLTK